MPGWLDSYDTIIYINKILFSSFPANFLGLYCANVLFIRPAGYPSYTHPCDASRCCIVFHLFSDWRMHDFKCCFCPLRLLLVTEQAAQLIRASMVCLFRGAHLLPALVIDSCHGWWIFHLWCIAVPMSGLDLGGLTWERVYILYGMSFALCMYVWQSLNRVYIHGKSFELCMCLWQSLNRVYILYGKSWTVHGLVIEFE